MLLVDVDNGSQVLKCSGYELQGLEDAPILTP